jgi:hypothetical protein
MLNNQRVYPHSIPARYHDFRRKKPSSFTMASWEMAMGIPELDEGFLLRISSNVVKRIIIHPQNHHVYRDRPSNMGW